MNKDDRVELARIQQQLDDHLPILKRIDAALPPMDKRIDRLEQVEVARKWHLRAIWTALLAGLTGIAIK